MDTRISLSYTYCKKRKEKTITDNLLYLGWSILTGRQYLEPNNVDNSSGGDDGSGGGSS